MYTLYIYIYIYIYIYTYIYVDVCYGVCIPFPGSNVEVIFTYGGSTIEICTSAALWSIPMVGICASSWWSSVHARNALSGCSLYCFKLGSLMLLSQLSSSHSSQYGGVYSMGVLAQSPNPSTFPSWWGGISFSRFSSTPMTWLTLW